jgi:ATP synthase protein I
MNKNNLRDLESLEKKLHLIRDKNLKEDKKEENISSKELGQGLRIGIEMVVSIFLGAGLGFLIDRWFNSFPIFMILFLILGFAAGIMNTLRIMSGLDEAVGLGRAVREKNKSKTED